MSVSCYADAPQDLGGGRGPQERFWQPQVAGQALLELAIIGPILVFMFAVMIRFGMQAMDAQAVQHEAFRKALYLADQATICYQCFRNKDGRSTGQACQPSSVPCNADEQCRRVKTLCAGTPMNSAFVIVVRDRSTPDPSSPFGTSASNPVVGSASIEWGGDLALRPALDPHLPSPVTYQAYGPGKVVETDELPKVFNDINGHVFLANASGFTEVVQENGTPYVNVHGPGHYQAANPLCRFNAAIPGTPMFGEVLKDDDITPLDPSRQHLAVVITREDCAIVQGAAGVEVKALDEAGQKLLKDNPQFRVKFYVLDPCMADAIDPITCARQCELLHPTQVRLNFTLPSYCTAPPDRDAVQGLDLNHYTRVHRINDQHQRLERADGGVVTTTRVDERETLGRTYKSWRGSAYDKDMTTQVRRRQRQRWETPPLSK